jgi:hypothetical protein
MTVKPFVNHKYILALTLLYAASINQEMDGVN